MGLFNVLGILGVVFAAGFYFTTAQIPKPVDCKLGSLQGTLRLNSPQFATLCRLPRKLKLTSKHTKLQNLTSALIGLTASGVCEGDCRCVMGAKGGKCGKRRDGKTYCKCDYVNAPKKSKFKLSCLNTFNVDVKNLICSKTAPLGKITYPLINDQACNSDCQCSHGYGNTGNHKCTTENGVAGNTQTYCVCEKATNLPS